MLLALGLIAANSTRIEGARLPIRRQGRRCPSDRQPQLHQRSFHSLSPARRGAKREKYHGWSDHDGDFEKIYTKDQLLTTVVIYWATDSGASSARIYYERRHQPAGATSRVSIPTGCANFNARFDKRPVAGARSSAEARYNIVRWTDMPRGGHFPAFEQPQLWVDEVRAFFRPLR